MIDRTQLTEAEFLICDICLNVEGIGWESCLPGREHDWVPALVTPCPFMTYTKTGRVSNERIKRADKLCGDSPDYDSHHYGDRERRHFTVAP